MANSKITDLAAGNPVAATDSFVIARAGANYKVTAADVWTIASASSLLWSTDTGLKRQSAGVVQATDGAAGLGHFYGRSHYIGLTPDVGVWRVTTNVLGISQGGETGNGQLSLENVGGHRIASGKVTLTEAGGAEVVAVVTTATTEMTGGELLYTIRATDATDRAVRTGSFRFAIQNGAGTVTANIATATNETNDGSAIISTSAKTLTYAIAADVATANKCKFTFNIDSDMVVSAASITWTMILNGPGTVSTS